MNTEKNIRIAELDGWKWVGGFRDRSKRMNHLVRDGRDMIVWKDGVTEGGIDYLNDLNAAVQLCDVLVLNGFTWVAMGVDVGVQFTAFKPRQGIRNREQYKHTAQTLAQAICGAFLKAKGRWEDET